MLNLTKTFSFDITARDSETKARCGFLRLQRGSVSTPVFMPVGTQGTVKGLLPEQLEDLGAEIILVNAYHLFLRPGVEIIEKAGGLHSFMHWNKPIVTDSGGYQVLSLSPFRKILEDGVTFRSHVDGALHQFTPEKVIQIQTALNADILMPLDECLPYPSDKEKTQEALQRTQQWLKRSFRQERKPHQALFAILQGGMFSELRREAAYQALSLVPDGIALGGLSVGEPRSLRWEILESLIPILPEEKPRYFMGLGTPEDLLEAVERGVDMFDSVFPTRAARAGLAFTSLGRLTIRNSPYRSDFSRLDPACSCYTCRFYSRAYLHHLLHAHEISACILLSYHNVAFLVQLMRKAGKAIQAGHFSTFKRQFLLGYLVEKL